MPNEERCLFCQEKVLIFTLYGGRLSWSEHYCSCPGLDDEQREKAQKTFVLLAREYRIECDHRRQMRLFSNDSYELDDTHEDYNDWSTGSDNGSLDS